jgi:hypothetical protein
LLRRRGPQRRSRWMVASITMGAAGLFYRGK